MACHCGPPGRGMASLVAPSNGTDLITINDNVNIQNQSLIILLLQSDQEVVGINGMFSTVFETQSNDYG